MLASIRPPKDRPCRATADPMCGRVARETRRDDEEVTRVGGCLVVAIFACAVDGGFGPPATMSGTVSNTVMWPSASDMLSIANVQAVRVIVSAGACELTGDRFSPVGRLGGVEPCVDLARFAACCLLHPATVASKSFAYLPLVILGGGSARNATRSRLQTASRTASERTGRDRSPAHWPTWRRLPLVRGGAGRRVEHRRLRTVVVAIRDHCRGRRSADSDPVVLGRSVRDHSERLSLIGVKETLLRREQP